MGVTPGNPTDTDTFEGMSSGFCHRLAARRRCALLPNHFGHLCFPVMDVHGGAKLVCAWSGVLGRSSYHRIISIDIDDKNKTNVSMLYCLNSRGPTPTPTRTLGMRLSCNFVDVYTIVYHVRVHARIPNGHPCEEKRARRTKVRVQVAAAGRLPRAPDTPTSVRGSSRGSRRGRPCRCRCPCRSRGI